MILRLDPRRPPKGAAEFAAALLQAGGVLALPTDTVYGLAADPRRPDALDKVYVLKGRPKSKALACLAASPRQALSFASRVPKAARRLAGRHWPGGLTLILPKGKSTLGLRVPDSKFAREVARCLGRPFAATSANLSGKPAMVKGSEVARAWAGKVDLVVDGGRCPASKESTVAAFNKKGEPVVLRQGAVKL